MKISPFVRCMVLLLGLSMLFTACGDSGGSEGGGGTRGRNEADIESSLSIEPVSSASVEEQEKVPETDDDEVFWMEFDWRLILVNKDNRMDLNYEVELGEIPASYLANQSANRIDARVVEPLLDMLRAAEADGVRLRITSAYRDIAYQTGLFNAKVDQFIQQGYNQEDAEEEASMFVAIPGTSEHNTGLALDIISSDWYTYNDDLYESFEDTEEFAWLDAHAAEYGFILRFPKDKVEVTQISYEPWHYRYVGVEHARNIKEMGICLEEYVEIGIYDIGEDTE